MEAISPPVVLSQPQSFSDAMLDPTSRGLMASLSTSHMSGTVLQGTIRQSADQLQRTIQGQFVSLKVGLLVREGVGVCMFWSPFLVGNGRVVECMLNCARNACACNAIQRGACVGRRMKRLSSKQEEQFI